MELRQEAGQREPGLLEAGQRDRPLETPRPGDQPELQGSARRFEQLAYGDRQ
jgi:hypothetical protein